MSWNVFFTIVLTLVFVLLFLRGIWLYLRRNSDNDPNFKNLPKEVKLAILKEALLNCPVKANLLKLSEFCEKESITLPKADYSIFLEEQERISKNLNAIELDNELFVKEAEWMDSILPLEFLDAKNAKESGDFKKYTRKSLEGILRLYSDKAIIEFLNSLKENFSSASKILESYKKLAEARESCDASEESLKKIRSQRDTWEREILQEIEILSN